MPDRVRIEDEDGVPVARVLEARAIDDRVAREIADGLAASVPLSEPLRLIVDFGSLTQVSSAFIGRVVMLQRRADRSGGTLRLCGMAPAIRETFRITNLDRVVTIVRDRREAREAFGPAT